jgi:hypothetical protein
MRTLPRRIRMAVCRSAASQALEQLQQFLRQRYECCSLDFAFRVNDDVPSSGYLLAMAAHDFTHPAPHAIAHYRAAQPFLDAETEAAQRSLIGAKKRGEVRIRAALPSAVDGVEFALAQQSRLSWKAQVLLRRIHRQRSLLLGGRKAMTPLLAARGQHFAATLGLHAHAESVCLGAASFPRLICTLWQSNPPVSSCFVSCCLIPV